MLQIGRMIRNRHNAKRLLRDTILPNPLLLKNRELEKRHSGEDGFVLCSGPSIKRQNLKKLAGKVVITQNHFHAHEDIQVINPAYHVVVPFFHPKEYSGDWLTWFSTMEEKLPESTSIVFDLNTRNLIEENGLFPRRDIRYMSCRISPENVSRAPVDITKSTLIVPTAVTQCLTLAIYLGFRRIYLLGSDLDQILNIRQREKLRFYGDSPITNNRAELENDEDQLATGYIWYHFWTIWLQLRLLKEEAARRGIEIVNLTDGGLLETFRRENYDTVVP